MKIQQAWELFKVAVRSARRREELRPAAEPETLASARGDAWSSMLCTRCGTRMGDHRVDVAVPSSARSFEDVKTEVRCPVGPSPVTA